MVNMYSVTHVTDIPVAQYVEVIILEAGFMI